MGNVINFQEAAKQTILQELEQALEGQGGCGFPEISHELYQQAIHMGVGEIASPIRINQKQEDGFYLHTMSARRINYCCYVKHPIDMQGNSIEPSQIVTMKEWLASGN